MRSNNIDVSLTATYVKAHRHVLAPDIIVSLYNPAGAPPAVLNSGADIRRGDYTDPTSLDTAFAGADALLLVSYPSIAYDVRVNAHRAAIDAAKRTGTIKRVYYTSLAFAGDSGAAVMRAHIDTEAYLKASGLAYTILREGIYSESYPLYFGFWTPAEGDEVLVPHSDGGVAWVSREDLGEGTARIMVNVSGCTMIGADNALMTALHRAGMRTRPCCFQAHALSPSRKSRST